jgi:hypothetical protein
MVRHGTVQYGTRTDIRQHERGNGTAGGFSWSVTLWGHKTREEEENAVDKKVRKSCEQQD